MFIEIVFLGFGLIFISVAFILHRNHQSKINKATLEYLVSDHKFNESQTTINKTIFERLDALEKKVKK